MLQEKLLRVCQKINFQNFKAANFKKYSKLFSIFLILTIFGLFLPSGFARALDIVALAMDNLIYPLIFVIFSTLLGIAWVIAWIAASILNATLNPAIMNSLFSNPAIYQGWTLIRDICNLLFLLIMLLVAFGTILQHSTYNIKNSLPKLILAIFLINFSYVIAGAIIDFGNVLMYGILKWMCASEATCFQDLTGGLMTVANDFANKYNIINVTKVVGWSGTGSQQVIGAAIAMVYVFMYAFILLALAAFIIVRTAALALLLILAPFAYFGEVMPGMEKIGSDWWSKIWSYTLFGPIFALMLYVAGQLAKITIAVPLITDPNLGWYSGTIVVIISNAFPLIFLLAIIPITKSLGLAGTDVIMKNTTGLRDGITSYAGGATDRFFARGANMTGEGNWAKVRRSLSYASPGSWKRAIKAHTSEQEHDYDVAAGKTRNVFARTDNFGKKSPVNYEQEAHERAVSLAGKDILTDDTKELMHQLDDSLKAGLMVRAEAIARKIATKGDTDALLEKNGFDVSPEGFMDYYKKNFEPKLGAKKTALLMSDIKELEAKDGNKSLRGTTDYDPEKKETISRDLSTNKGQEELVKAEVSSFYKDSASQAMSRLNKKTMLDKVRVTETDKDGNIVTVMKDGKKETVYKKDSEGKFIYDWQMGANGRGNRIIEKMTEPYFEKAKNIKETESEEIYKALLKQKSGLKGNPKNGWNNLERLKDEENDAFNARVAKYERFEERLGSRYKIKEENKGEKGGKKEKKKKEGLTYRSSTPGMTVSTGGGHEETAEEEAKKIIEEDDEAEDQEMNENQS